MKIGIDISCLQGPHKMRGIGYTAMNILKNLPVNDKSSYVFYVESNDGVADIIEMLPIDKKRYTIRTFEKTPQDNGSRANQISKAIRKFRQLSVFRKGTTKYRDTHDLDVFLQLDQNVPMPRVHKTTEVVFIAYDLIPFIFEVDYLPSFKTNRQKGRSLRSSLKAALNRYVYIEKVRLNVRRADKILAISETTKKDFVKYLHAPGDKFSVITLGVNSPVQPEQASDGIMSRYHDTSWGYIPSDISLKNANFLLFVGGADERRRLHDLVAAFNQLKAQGSTLKLVLSGDIMKGPGQIPTASIRKALESSSYLEDIIFVGFTNDATRNWLYKNALAFIFPSVYEGFGLPVLEALSYETPVICYDTKAVREVAANAPIYADDVYGIVDAVKHVQALNNTGLLRLAKKGKKQTELYSWEQTVKSILKIISQ